MGKIIISGGKKRNFFLNTSNYLTLAGLINMYRLYCQSTLIILILEMNAAGMRPMRAYWKNVFYSLMTAFYLFYLCYSPHIPIPAALVQAGCPWGGDL